MGAASSEGSRAGTSTPLASFTPEDLTRNLQLLELQCCLPGCLGNLLVLQVSRLVHEDILVLVEVDAILGSVNSV